MLQRTFEFKTPRDCGKPYTVSQINAGIAAIIEGGSNVVWFTGEVSNFKRHTSGHCYLRLKDAESQVPAVIWNTTVDELGYAPEDGAAVMGVAAIRVYRRGGYYQLDIRRLQPAGLGALHVAFEKLKGRLAAEGLFDEARKRPLPRSIARLGVITARTGAAIHDILRVVSQRSPRTDICFINVRVQGAGAADSIAAAIGRMNAFGNVDAIIVGRGGGSIEDLWAFNEEVVARAIAASAIPVISAVGHETDFTIADFVADVRAPTPSAAAEMATADEEESRRLFVTLGRRLVAGYLRYFRDERQRFDALLSGPALRRPFRLLVEGREALADHRQRNARAMGLALRRAGERMAAHSGRLQALSPLAVLGRGYSVVSRADGAVVKDSAQLSPGEEVVMRFSRGTALAKVKEKVHAD
jgi:exodeoxyribonuclease VII large subunit